MKHLIFVALCICISSADDFVGRHYNQHHHTLLEAKQKISESMRTSNDGPAPASFEEVGSYSGIGTIGISGTDLSSTDASELTSFSRHGVSSFDPSNAAAYGSTVSNIGTSLVIPEPSSNTNSYIEKNQNFQQHIRPELTTTGNGRHDNYIQHEVRNNAINPNIFMLPSGGFENFYHHEERRVSNQQTTPIVHNVSQGELEKYIHHEEHERIQSQSPLIKIPRSKISSENIVHHEERHLQNNDGMPVFHFATRGNGDNVHHEDSGMLNQPAGIVKFSTPSSGTENYIHHEERRIQNQVNHPIIHFAHAEVPATSSGTESYINYRTVTKASQPHTTLMGNSVNTDSNLGASVGGLASLSTNNLNSISTGMRGGYASPSAIKMHNTRFGLGARSDTLSEDNKSDGSLGLSLGFQSSSNYGPTLVSESSYKSQYGSNFGKSTFGSNLSSSSELQQYVTEAERLAKMQAQGIYVGGVRSGGTHIGYNSRSASDNGNDGGMGIVGGGYKTKSWEKSSKWSSQSQIGHNGQLKHYKELSTGESEQYDINGKRAGYKVATTTLDDNGKLSSYSLYT